MVFNYFEIIAILRIVFFIVANWPIISSIETFKGLLKTLNVQYYFYVKRSDVEFFHTHCPAIYLRNNKLTFCYRITSHISFQTFCYCPHRT